MIQALEAMAFGLHQEHTHPDLLEWPKATKVEAQAILTSITSFDFIVSFAIAHTLLGALEGITNKLQKRGLDVYEAHKMVIITFVDIVQERERDVFFICEL